MADRPRRLVVLVQYDPSGGLPEYVRIHLQRLRPVATRLVLISNSPLSADARAAAERLCDEVRVRDNIGWDFAGWRDALAVHDMAEWDAVILTNSSIVGPLYPLEPIIDHMDTQGHDFWGMVHSRHIDSHLQSYFLNFASQVITSETWRCFWRDVDDLQDKKDVIRNYEVGLSQRLRASGFSFGHLIEDPRFPRSVRLVRIDRLKSRIRVPMNVNYVNKTVELYQELIEQGMPYLKASLLWGKDIYRRRSLEYIKSLPGTSYPWEEIGF